MELFVNDLSIHHQFHDSRSFSAAFDRLIAMRDAAQNSNHKVYIHQAICGAEPIQGIAMQQALGHLESNKQRAIMSWLSRGGPFWDNDDIREHGEDDYLECQSEIVTDSAVGEAAFRAFQHVECGLVSAVPSDWDYSPVEVTWHLDSEESGIRSTTLENWRCAAKLKERLRDARPPVRSWDGLEDVSTDRFTALNFSNNCFACLKGVPFAKSTSERILALLEILDRLTRSFDTKGVRTGEGHQIYQEYFTGEKQGSPIHRTMRKIVSDKS